MQASFEPAEFGALDKGVAPEHVLNLWVITDHTPNFRLGHLQNIHQNVPLQTEVRDQHTESGKRL